MFPEKIIPRKSGDKTERTIKMELGIASVAAITAITYLVGMAVKATEAAAGRSSPKRNPL